MSTSTSNGGGGGAGSGSAGGATTGMGGSTGNGGSGAGGGTPSGHFLCPDKDPFNNPAHNTVVVTDATLTADTTWTADKTWVLPQSLDVDQHTLTIEAGTVVCFGSGVVLTVGAVNPGVVDIGGTAASHVTFTSTTSDGKTPDFFGGLLLNQYAGSSLSYLDIFYGGEGGGGAAPAFEIAFAPAGTYFPVDHLTVAEVQSEGLRFTTSDFTGPSGLDPASVIHFAGYHTHAAGDPPLLPAVHADILVTSSFTPSTLQIDVAGIPVGAAYIDVEASPGPLLNSSVTWVDLGIPWLLPDIDVFGGGTLATAASFTIQEGVTVLMGGNLILGDTQTQSYGNLIVQGSAQKPVIFTSPAAAMGTTPKPGDWGSVYFYAAGFDPTVSSIDHAEFHYGGASAVDNPLYSCTNDGDGQGEVEIDGSGAYAGPPITNSLFADSVLDGIRAKVDPVNGDYITTDYSTSNDTFSKIPGKDYPPVNPPDVATCMQ